MRLRNFIRNVTLAASLLALFSTNAVAQSWTSPRTWVTGELVSASIMNSAIRDNLLVLRAGGFAVTSQAIGDLLCASTTTQFARLADVATGQVLKSGGVGACPSYATINVAFLSDGTNVALLNASNTFAAANPIILGGAANGTLRTDNAGLFTSQAGTSGFEWHNNANSATLMSLSNAGALGATAAFNGFQSIIATNTTSGTGAGSLLRVVAGTTIGQLVATSQGYTTGTFDIQASTYLSSAGVGGLSLVATDAAGVIRLYTNSLLRWGVNAAGDHTFGASSHIADSNGTPTKNSCTGGACSWSIDAGSTDYAMTLTISTATTVTVSFGHTFSSNAVCGLTSGVTSAVLYLSGGTSTTGFTVAAVGGGGLPGTIYVLCRGF